MENPLILDAALRVDGWGSLAGLERRVTALLEAGLAVVGLEIDSLRAPWMGRPDREGPSFQSGCGPILALARTREILQEGGAEAVVIRGEEPLRTGYKPAERRRLMDVYGDTSIPEAYTGLARLQMQRLELDEAAYRGLADRLLDNYGRTAERRGLATESEHGGRAATSLFRYADCANPNLDFTGAVLLGTAQAAQALELSASSCPRLLAEVAELREDGPECLADLAGYDHLRQAYARACGAAGIDFAALFATGEALLEAYTCFPPVPLGFLLASGIAPDVPALASILDRHEITVTGGMNLAGAPWNNHVLHALIVMWERLASGVATAPRVGLLHGNGGVGGYQGVALIGVGGA